MKIRPKALRAKAATNLAYSLSGASANAELVELTSEQYGAVMELNRKRTITKSDSVEIGLCGSHRERWVKAGRPLRSDVDERRLAMICSKCNETLRGMPCKNQQCTHAGLRAATYDCPKGKW